MTQFHGILDGIAALDRGGDRAIGWPTGFAACRAMVAPGTMAARKGKPRPRGHPPYSSMNQKKSGTGPVPLAATPSSARTGATLARCAV
ncbi:hypothetical protein [Cupriavidus necator]|uniref:hypothetical protein n=1 Tax=Cupriavidus necator TaxID=106590 RepID=UPI002783AB50|nr:hypothetical protein [Cupriavidus necator]MDQ0139997.1 hypothetical protein [Cupriavidus necator]